MPSWSSSAGQWLDCMALSKVASDASVRPRSTARVMVAAKESGVRRRGKVWRSELWT
jgi:hypothetical protein